MSTAIQEGSQTAVKRRVRCGEMDCQFRKRLTRKIRLRGRKRVACLIKR